MKILSIFVSSLALCVGTNKMYIGINDFKPTKPEVRMCTGLKLDRDTTYHFTQLKPAFGKNIHHMVINGCKDPGTHEKYWNCGQTANLEPNYKKAGYCKENGGVWIYEWSFRASGSVLSLPDDFSFQLGKGTESKYIVLEVHFGNAASPGKEDESNGGVFLTYDKKPLKDTDLAIFNMQKDEGRLLPAKQKTNVEMIGIIPSVLQPLKFIVHTHETGVKVSGYLIKGNTLGLDKPTWIKLGLQSPPFPQDFFSIVNRVIMEPGDLIAARCTFYNPNDEDMKLGPKDTDEMCEFGVLYATKRGGILERDP